MAVERKSERMDTAYSPRFREEELPDADNEHCRAQASPSDAANKRANRLYFFPPLNAEEPERARR